MRARVFVCGCAGGVMDRESEREIREPSSTSSRVRYIRFYANTIGKGTNPSIRLSLAMG